MGGRPRARGRPRGGPRPPGGPPPPADHPASQNTRGETPPTRRRAGGGSAGSGDLMGMLGGLMGGGQSSSGATSTTVALGWSASTDTGGAGLVGYRVYRDGSATAPASVTGTTFTDTGLTPGTNYSYVVTAFDAASNESAASGPVNGRQITGNKFTMSAGETWPSASCSRYDSVPCRTPGRPAESVAL